MERLIGCLKEALKWWEDDIQYLTEGEYGGHNVFDDDPEWVINARWLLGKSKPASAPPVMIKAVNACVGCSVILEDMAQRYCLSCQTMVDNGAPVDSFGMLMPTLMGSRIGYLLQSDVDILDGSVNRAVRTNVLEDAEVKRLYDIYKTL